MAVVDELREQEAALKTLIKRLDATVGGDEFSDEQRAEWNKHNEDLEAVSTRIAEIDKEMEARRARVAALVAESPEDVEDEPADDEAEAKSRKPVIKRTHVPADLHDLQAYRSHAGSFDELQRAYTEGALRIAETLDPRNPDADVDATKSRVEKILKHVDIKGDDSPEDRVFAQRMIMAGSPVYERAFSKKLAGKALNSEEERALSTTTTAGGFAVPVVLDPTVVLTSAGVNNPVRRIARVETITSNLWYGVSSTGISASYGAEAGEASDNAPALVQPSAQVEKAQAFIPFSIEIGQDWGALSSEMASLFAAAKDDLESSKFLTGLGHGSTEPQGLIAVGGATAVVTTATTAVFALIDLFSLENALQPRSQANASFVGSKAAYQKIRQFDTAGGGGLWVQLQFGEPANLIGYPAYEWSSYSGAVTTSGSTVMTFGDFSKFLIIDRVGMDVELIPHLFATANNRPSGQRGLYCYWRNTSVVLNPGLSANSAFQSLKIL